MSQSHEERARAWLQRFKGWTTQADIRSLAGLLGAVERETVERCARVAADRGTEHGWDIADEIRALIPVEDAT